MQMKTGILLGICAGLLCCRGADGQFADIPVLSCSGLPCVEARLDGGAPIRLVLDFSNFTSYVSAAVVRNRRSESSSRVQLGPVVLTDRFPVVNPRSKKSMDQLLMEEFPGGDGGLSLRAFAGRLLVLDLPHRRLRIWNGSAPGPTCSRRCGNWVLVREGDIVGIPIWEADDFSLNNRPVRALLDPLYPGAVIASRVIEGLIFPERRGDGVVLPGVATGRQYRGDRLFSIGSIFVTFAGATVCSSASLVRYQERFGRSAVKHEATIGLGILSTFPIALDFRKQTMWIFDSEAKAVDCH